MSDHNRGSNNNSNSSQGNMPSPVYSPFINVEEENLPQGDGNNRRPQGNNFFIDQRQFILAQEQFQYTQFLNCLFLDQLRQHRMNSPLRQHQINSPFLNRQEHPNPNPVPHMDMRIDDPERVSQLPPQLAAPHPAVMLNNLFMQQPPLQIIQMEQQLRAMTQQGDNPMLPFTYMHSFQNPDNNPQNVLQVLDNSVQNQQNLVQMNWLPPFTNAFGYQVRPGDYNSLLSLIQEPRMNRQRIVRQSSQPQPPMHLNSKYYQKRKEPRPPVEFNESEPHLKISYVKQSDHNHEEAYYITQHGMHNSQKNTDIDDIMIGRQQNINIQQEMIYPNDIALPYGDRAISRVHCKLLIKEGFRRKDDMQDDFRGFLGVCYKSKLWAQLPIHILHKIQQFAFALGQFYIQDLGSVQGTYIKVKNNRELPVEEGNTFFIGADTLFHIKKCQNNFSQQSVFHKALDETDLKYLLWAKQCDFDIHGLSQEEHQMLERKASGYIGMPFQQWDETNFPNIQLSRPFLIVQFTNMTPSQSPNRIFVASRNQDAVFKIGRNQDNDVIISYNTISRKQCRIRYSVQDLKWYISDGESLRESSNGTWMSLSNNFDKKNIQRDESHPYPLENNSEIKISESVLKVEMINFHKQQSKTQKKFDEKNKAFLKKLMLKYCEQED